MGTRQEGMYEADGGGRRGGTEQGRGAPGENRGEENATGTIYNPNRGPGGGTLLQGTGVSPCTVNVTPAETGQANSLGLLLAAPASPHPSAI